MGPENFLIVLTTLPVDHDADQFARVLVEERLAACVSVLPPMRSTYAWQGAIETADERQIVIKTVGTRLDALQTRVRQLHPYKVPEFLMVAVEGSADYLAWLTESTGP